MARLYVEVAGSGYSAAAGLRSLCADQRGWSADLVLTFAGPLPAEDPAGFCRTQAERNCAADGAWAPVLAALDALHGRGSNFAEGCEADGWDCAVATPGFAADAAREALRLRFGPAGRDLSPLPDGRRPAAPAQPRCVFPTIDLCGRGPDPPRYPRKDADASPPPLSAAAARVLARVRGAFKAAPTSPPSFCDRSPRGVLKQHNYVQSVFGYGEEISAPVLEEVCEALRRDPL